MKTLLGILATAAAIVLAVHLFGSSSPGISSVAPAATAADARKEAAFQRAVLLMRAITRAANDPDSISVESAFYLPDGTVVVKYRGRNAFNALVRNTAVATPEGDVANGTPREIRKLWNRRVAGKPSTDMTPAIVGAKTLHAW